MDVSPTIFEIFSSKIPCFSYPSLVDAPSGGMPCDINIIYTPLKITFNRLQFNR